MRDAPLHLRREPRLPGLCSRNCFGGAGSSRGVPQYRKTGNKSSVSMDVRQVG